MTAGPIAALRAAAAAIIVLALAGCGATPPPASTPAPTAPRALAADRVILRVDEVCGPTCVHGTFDPRLATLTADGTLVVADPARPVMLPAVTARLAPGALDALWATVVDGGLARDGSLDLPGLYDAGTTRFTVDGGSGATTLDVYALGSEPAAPDQATFSPADSATRRNAAAALAMLRDLGGSLPWTPPALLLWWGPFEDPPAGPRPSATPWTAPIDLASAGAAVDNPLFARCARLEGADAAAVAGLARTLARDAVVERDGVRYAIAVRPIHPDEGGSVTCDTPSPQP